jgi:hypothetical protein
MKLKSMIPERSPSTLIRRFGEARLVRHRNGEHELIGGNTGDRTAAYEWVSLFAHEIVFRHFHGQADQPARKSLGLPRIWVTVN